MKSNLLSAYDVVISAVEERLTDAKASSEKVGQEIQAKPKNVELNTKIEKLMKKQQTIQNKIYAIPLVKMYNLELQKNNVTLGSLRQELYNSVGITEEIKRAMIMVTEVTVLETYLETLKRDKKQLEFKDKLDAKREQENK